MDTRPIGFFDSGSGGLSIYTSVTAALPSESTVYIGDHACVPYGGRPKTFIVGRAIAAIRFLVAHDVKLVVVACNTATVAGIDRYRSTFPDLPIVGVVPVVKTAAAMSKTGTIAVLSTAYTAKSAYQKNLIATHAAGKRVFNAGSSTLVPAIEKGETDSPAIRTALSRMLAPTLRAGCDVIALGCTHYPFVTAAVREVAGTGVAVIDSGEAVARQVGRVLSARDAMAPHDAKPTHTFFTTGDARAVSRVASVLLGYGVVVSHASIAYNGQCDGT